MRIYITLIRHGKTAGNLRRQYIGRTDEALCQDGIRELSASSRILSRCEAGPVYTSPMRRCMQTADLLFPNAEKRIVEDFRECDFGSYEGKTYEELLGDEVYQQFLETGHISGFPQGETTEAFKRRCISAFDQVMAQCVEENSAEAVCVVHGGVIMSIMEKYAVPRADYYAWQIGNAEGYRLEMETKAWNNGDRHLKVQRYLRRSGQ